LGFPYLAARADGTQVAMPEASLVYTTPAGFDEIGAVGHRQQRDHIDFDRSLRLTLVTGSVLLMLNFLHPGADEVEVVSQILWHGFSPLS
jgi:hypothetical protein